MDGQGYDFWKVKVPSLKFARVGCADHTHMGLGRFLEGEGAQLSAVHN
jgi:hypothetical protein